MKIDKGLIGVGDLLLVLSLLAEKDRYGYEQLVEEKTQWQIYSKVVNEVIGGDTHAFT